MKVLTGDEQQTSKLFKIKVAQFPASNSLDTDNLNQSNYSVLVPLERLLAEMTLIKRRGGRIVNMLPAEAKEQPPLKVSYNPWFATVVSPPAEVSLRPKATEGEVQGVIHAVYKQLYGNTHLFESDQLTSGESLLRQGSISVREFVRLVAKSEVYKERFFHCTSNNRFIELNLKHLLGRPPYSQSEIVEHLDRYHTHGYDKEIDSYIDSDEYQEAFGEDTVPYWRTFQYTVGQTAAAFERTFRLFSGEAGSDTDRNTEGQVRKVDAGKLLGSGRGIV